MANESNRRISIVIPVYNEAQNLLRLFERLRAVASDLCSYGWEFVLVNDGSNDDSWRLIVDLAAADPRVKGIDLSRNFGKEAALSAGTSYVCGDAMICIDADLQHPPEMIPELVRQWEQGAEMVATRRTRIAKQPLLRRAGSHLYYWTMSKISGVSMVSQTTDFRLYDRKVIDAFVRFTERGRMFRGIMDWMGYRKAYVEFEAPARERGEAGYSYRRLFALAVGSMTSFSLLPLKLSGYLGLFIASLSALLLFWMAIDHFWLKYFGFTTLSLVVVANTFLIGVVLMAIGLVALYIGTIHTEVINRPLFLVREEVGISPVDRRFSLAPQRKT